MKLNPEALVVSSFETADAPEAAAIARTTPQCPTPMTFCFVCPPIA